MEARLKKLLGESISSDRENMQAIAVDFSKRVPSNKIIVCGFLNDQELFFGVSSASAFKPTGKRPFHECADEEAAETALEDMADRDEPTYVCNIMDSFERDAARELGLN
jgi:hypothetical protein